MRRLLRIGSAVLLAAAALAVVLHAVDERRQAVRARETIAGLVAALAALQPAGHTTVHASFNGARTRIAFASSSLSLGDAADAALLSCGHDEETGGAERLPNGDQPARRFAREGTHRDDAADGSASAVLCVFRSLDTGERRERLTLVRRADDGASSTVTITRESAAALAEMFPVDGDAPGDDLPGAPRPLGSRRVVAASVLETGHAVRIYEIPGAAEIDGAVATFDRQMAEAGWTSSPAVAASLREARLYMRGAERIVASFERTAGATRIALGRVALL